MNEYITTLASKNIYIFASVLFQEEGVQLRKRALTKILMGPDGQLSRVGAKRRPFSEFGSQIFKALSQIRPENERKLKNVGETI